jgi:hypothetical protein
LISARQIFTEGLTKDVINELKLRQQLVLRKQASPSLFDPASEALLEACEVVQYAYDLRSELLQNGGQYPAYDQQLLTAQGGLTDLQNTYNKIMKDLERERKEIDNYEKAGAVKRLVLSKDNYLASKENEKSAVTDLMKLSAKLTEAELLVADISHTAQLLTLVQGKYADTMKLLHLDLAKRVGENSARVLGK